jgi:hypothetical protein
MSWKSERAQGSATSIALCLKNPTNLQDTKNVPILHKGLAGNHRHFVPAWCARMAGDHRLRLAAGQAWCDSARWSCETPASTHGPIFTPSSGICSLRAGVQRVCAAGLFEEIDGRLLGDGMGGGGMGFEIVLRRGVASASRLDGTSFLSRTLRHFLRTSTLSASCLLRLTLSCRGAPTNISFCWSACYYIRSLHIFAAHTLVTRLMQRYHYR